MNLLALPAALVLPTVCGWLGLRLIEGKSPVLLRAERWVLGSLLGLSSLLFLQFVLQVTLGLPFTLMTFLGVQGACTLMLGAAWMLRRKNLPPSLALPASEPMPRSARALLTVLLTWSGVKAAFVAMVFLLLVPAYLQDTLSNWNLRGKVLYVTQQMTLVMPNEDPALSPRGVSSYPPTVPLAKVLMSNWAGEWNETLVNAIHLFWYLCALALVYLALRRYVSRGWALLGLYLIMSLPLYLMHGTNAYADAFVSVHVFAAVSLLFHASRARDPGSAASFLKMAGLAGGLLAFTKNEGLIVFLPPFLLCGALTLGILLHKRVLTAGHAVRLAVFAALCVAAIAGPWLFFKWANGLTFGNGKPFTSLGFGWQKGVTFSIIVNTFSEGNWLLLFPLFFGLLAWKFRETFGWLLVPSTFFLLVYVGQMLLYLFTGLSREAIVQTGYARGIIHLTPVLVLLTTLLLWSIRQRIREGLGALAYRLRLQPR